MDVYICYKDLHISVRHDAVRHDAMMLRDPAVVHYMCYFTVCHLLVTAAVFIAHYLHTSLVCKGCVMRSRRFSWSTEQGTEGKVTLMLTLTCFCSW